MSGDLAGKVRLGLDDLATVRDQMSPLIATPPDSKVAREFGEPLPASEAWHKDLLKQMAVPTNARPAAIAEDLVEVLS